MVCKHCDDGDGNSVYPYYGMAPHLHGTGPGFTIGAHFKPREFWPANFREDPEAPNCGTYTHCLHCGAGEPHPEEELKDRIRGYK